MEQTIKVSVLMLTYNHEAYVDEAIRSVVLQNTRFDFELIIADDASSDGTCERCRQWQARFPQRVRLLSGASNVGLARNFIRCFEAARGTYIAICEGDDFWCDRHKLQRQVDFLDTHPAYSACFHQVVNYYEADGSKSLSGRYGKEAVTLRDLALCNPITNVSICYRRALIPSLPTWMDQVTSYDFVMHCLCAVHGDIYFMPRAMAVYRKLPTSIWTGANKEKRAMISRKNRDLLIAYFQTRDAEVCTLLRTANARNCLDIAYYYAMQKEEDKVAAWKQQALTYRDDWSAEDVAREYAALGMAQRSKSICRSMLTRIRQLVSRCLPLPRIHSTQKFSD